MSTIKDPDDLENIVWPASIFTFAVNSTFLLAEQGNNKDKIFIFTTVAAKEAMSNSDIFFMDSTFKSCSKQFYQFYTILADIGSTQHETNVMQEAVLLALKSELPDVNMSGCNFPFNQSLWRKVQNLGLVKEDTNDDSTRLHIRMCASLVYLPISDVHDGWLRLNYNKGNNYQKNDTFM
ncbi:hypothetical protein QE152_g10571 [Popillia japonica]|uniref:Uncharacterized protein n=1 Tax=Popillia japonica TaxID=7064 RepID=A0AAW1LUU7_POPJA